MRGPLALVPAASKEPGRSRSPARCSEVSHGLRGVRRSPYFSHRDEEHGDGRAMAHCKSGTRLCCAGEDETRAQPDLRVVGESSGRVALGPARESVPSRAMNQHVVQIFQQQAVSQTLSQATAGTSPPISLSPASSPQDEGKSRKRPRHQNNISIQLQCESTEYDLKGNQKAAHHHERFDELGCSPGRRSSPDTVLSPGNAVLGVQRNHLVLIVGNGQPCEISNLKALRASLPQERSSIVANYGLRGVDVLKRILRLGKGSQGRELAWLLEVHDLGLMRDALEGNEVGRAAVGATCGDGVVLSTRFGSNAAGEAQARWSRLLSDPHAMSTYVLTCRAQLMVAWMEISGVPFDPVGLQELLLSWQEETVRIEAQARRDLDVEGRFGSMSLVNIRSASQIAAAIERKLSPEQKAAWPRTPGGALRTDSATLRRSSLPFALSVIRYREIQHLLSHYAPYKSAAVTGGGRLYPTFNLAGAVTGRMSCTNPNLHSIPRLPAFRALVAAQTGGVLVKGDFSQIELRVLAELSGDRRMLLAFADGEDLHCITAAAVLDVREENVSAEDRQLAKAINFGLVYGQSSQGLQQTAEVNFGIEISLEEAMLAQKRFFQTYPGVAAWQIAQRRLASCGVAIRTPCGRTAHHLRAAWSNASLDAADSIASQAEGRNGVEACSPRIDAKARTSFASSLGRVEREALNFPIQGGAAEVMLACLGRLRLQLASLHAQCRLICVVHDEFILECVDKTAAPRVLHALRLAMLEAWRQVFPAGVPLDDRALSLSTGPDWACLEPQSVSK
eukprot:TRINITY_DN24644_c0_g1_i1.p1 TRINITY_DN24644_c0_g1~~TRINITY_DN24644_c0_g1_i1.p1  ORF type:complete len:790 (+),score=91.61 TRINITY_DN24644_c0_g1_i1:183-2552(+)